MNKKSIYFLCTGNACRSQMAEGWANYYLAENWEVASAGIEAHGVNPKAVKAMKQIGIDITKQTSDIIDPEKLAQTTLVITLCGDAKDNCPTIPSHVKHEHWGFPDPAGKSWGVFEQVRDAIGERIRQFAENEQAK